MTRLNNWLATKITGGVSTMWCAYAFMALALYGLPTALAPGGSGFVAWLAQTFIQLVLLSIIMVGQKIQSAEIGDLHTKVDAHHKLITDAHRMVEALHRHHVPPEES